MRKFNEVMLWRCFATSAWLILLGYLIVAIIYTLATPKIMMNYAFKDFWLNNIFLYIGLLCIGILALKRMKLSLLISLALFYTIAHRFYLAFFWSTARSAGFAGTLLYISIILGVVMELICICLIMKLWFNRTLFTPR